jgi:Cu/Ag efflux pump CusA
MDLVFIIFATFVLFVLTPLSYCIGKLPGCFSKYIIHNDRHRLYYKLASNIMACWLVVVAIILAVACVFLMEYRIAVVIPSVLAMSCGLYMKHEPGINSKR